MARPTINTVYILQTDPEIYLDPEADEFQFIPEDSVAKCTGALYCELDAELLARYRKGGYHPTHLDDTFKDGRYKTVHKLGWGGYAVVWLARDLL